MQTTDIEAITTLLKVDTTELILIDYGQGRGKIIINDNESGINTSYYWGAMGGSLKDFLLNIDSGYFVGKLGAHGGGDINIKATMRYVREFIKNETPLAWYMDLNFNKRLRDELNYIQRNCCSPEHFIDMMCNLSKKLDPKDCEYEYEAEELLNMISSEPWYFIIHAEPRVNVWLSKFFHKMQKTLKKL